MAADLPWRTLDIVQGHSLRWRVEVFVQDWTGHAGWAQLTKQPGEEGARRSVILRLRVAHALFVHPAQAAQRHLQHFTNARHEVCAFGRSKKPMIQRQLGRLEPTPSLQYRADEVMRNMPVMST